MKAANATKVHKQCHIGTPPQLRGTAHPRRRLLLSPRLSAPQGSQTPSAVPASSHAAPSSAIPRVLHIDSDPATANALVNLLSPEATVVHVATVADARRLLQTELYSLVILDTMLSDGDGRALLAALSTTPLLLYSACQPDVRSTGVPYLPKPWTSPRQLWSTISAMLGIGSPLTAGD